jgi:hypothetical protein
VALVTYLQRLKEQGWNVDRTERKMLMCGVPSLAAAATSCGASPAALGAAGRWRLSGLHITLLSV